MNPAIREQLERCPSLPSLPAVAVQILEMCQKDDLDLNQIAATVARDPALSAKLIKTANSPIFSVRREVTTISYAVSLLGANAVRTLVLSFSLARDNRPGGASRLKGYWRRSLLSAMAAREIAQVRQLNGDEAFLAGLLQDIGMLALARAAALQYNKILDAAGADHDRLAELERAAFGTDHAGVGSWLLTRWRAPRVLADIVAASHQPELLATQEREDVRALGEVVALSARFADLWAGDIETAPAALSAAIRERWPEGSVDIEGITKRLIENVPQMAPLFEVKLGADEMSSVLEQAQDALVALSIRASQEVQHIHEALSRLESRTAALLAEAQRDPLTGVANRGYTDNYLDQVFHAAIESNRTIGVIFADVDHFKQINDNFGHAAGDAVLQAMARAIGGSLRGGDFVGRYGGEEFVVIVRADSVAELTAVAERVRRTIEEKRHSIGNGSSVPVTISLGSSLLNRARHRTPADLLGDADAALYAAKRRGRNQHCFSDDTATRPRPAGNAAFANR